MSLLRSRRPLGARGLARQVVECMQKAGLGAGTDSMQYASVGPLGSFLLRTRSDDLPLR
jgi:hypothetical protein